MTFVTRFVMPLLRFLHCYTLKLAKSAWCEWYKRLLLYKLYNYVVCKEYRIICEWNPEMQFFHKWYERSDAHVIHSSPVITNTLDFKFRCHFSAQLNQFKMNLFAFSRVIRYYIGLLIHVIIMIMEEASSSFKRAV